MKKIIYILMALIMMGTNSFAQNKDAKKQKAPAGTAKGATSKDAKDGKEAKGEKKPKLKKDGTPDMRYKENKDAAKAGGPKKKDGTPDKRFKANRKETPKTK